MFKQLNLSVIAALLLTANVLLITSTSFTVNAQQRMPRGNNYSSNNSYSPQYNFGPKIGLSIGSFTKEPDATSLTGLVLGLYGEYKMQPKLSISGELLYSQQGAMFEYERSEERILLDYINIPVLLSYYASNSFAFKMGLQAGYLLSATVQYTDFRYDATDTEDVIKYCNTLDFSIPVGLSYTFDFGLKIDARYNFGLSKILKRDGNYTNSVFQITLGYNLDL